MDKKTILMSPADSKIYEFFERQFNVICTDCLEDFIPYERYHADMQALKIKDKLFINAKCKKLINKLTELGINYIICEGIGNNYPNNVALNAALIGNKLLCNEKALHPLIKDYCNSSGIDIVHVKQGYTKCSTLVIDENSIITDDESIHKSAVKAGIDVLLIKKGDIFLNENNYGFIGGASVVIGKTVYFFGSINTHQDYDKLKGFILKKNMNIECTGTQRLIDIGGIIILD
ncbi:MAG: hypothetical protein IJW04_00335 [Ruminococcus sp.]|nr:hypothetical protein [Ruminococcus sp.]